MTKNELIHYPFNEILKLVKNKDFFKQKIENQSIFSIMLKSYSSEKIIKILEVNPNILNEKDSNGCYGTERLIDAGLVDVLEKYADKIDLLKKDYEESTNMLGYLCKKKLNTVLDKALEINPNALNEKDPSGCYGTERLIDAGLVDILEKYADKIDLLKKDYEESTNMLGYLCKKKLNKVLNKALEVNHNALNEKDPSGCYGTERLADAGLVDVLEKYADKIDLFKKDYEEITNMLGYLCKKKLNTVLDKALEVNPNALNEKDPHGCYGTERLIDAGLVDVLEKYADKIDLLKKDYEESTNMLGYLCKKKLNTVLDKALEINPNALNEKDPSNCYGTERLADAGFITLIKKISHEIDWSKRATNNQSIFEYVIKKSNSQAEEICIRALIKTPSIINKEMKFIIDSGLTKMLTFQEIIHKIDKKIMIGNLNILGYLTIKNQEHYIDLILNPEKSTYYFNNAPHIIQEEAKKLLNKEEEFLLIKIEKELSSDDIKAPSALKLKIKSML